MIPACYLLVPVAAVAFLLFSHSVSFAEQTDVDVLSFVNSCMGPISEAGLGCPCSRIGGQCRDPLSICDLTHHCKCDGSKGYLADSSSVCQAYPTTTTSAPVTCPTTVAPVTCPTTTTTTATTTVTPAVTCGTFGFLVEESQDGYTNTNAIDCVLLDKGGSTVLEHTSLSLQYDSDVRFQNRVVTCPGGSSFQVEILALSDEYCDDLMLTIYDKVLCGARGQTLIGTQLTVPASFFAVAFFATDEKEAHYRIRVTCI